MVDAVRHLGGYPFDLLALDFDLRPWNGCVVGGAVEIDEQVLASEYSDEFKVFATQFETWRQPDIGWFGGGFMVMAFMGEERHGQRKQDGCNKGF